MTTQGLLSLLVIPALSVCLSAQGVPPYRNAITDRLFHAKTPMTPPSVNTVFVDPDFGSKIVRVTDGNSDPKGKGR
ncbi:MAG: hypothetical protein LAO22_23450, partial [Acidobacteriia bacterium]|nr:hypothetical protein [Terriglobia bacterium]